MSKKTTGFYVYNEEDTCFDCGRADKNIIGWYKGSPTKEKMQKIAEKQFEELHGRKPEPADYQGDDRLIDVGDSFFRIFSTFYTSRCDYYQAEEFELKEV